MANGFILNTRRIFTYIRPFSPIHGSQQTPTFKHNYRLTSIAALHCIQVHLIIMWQATINLHFIYCRSNVQCMKTNNAIVLCERFSGWFRPRLVSASADSARASSAAVSRCHHGRRPATQSTSAAAAAAAADGRMLLLFLAAAASAVN